MSETALQVTTPKVIEAGYKLELDLAYIEEMYAKGAHHHHVAEGLGISKAHWEQVRNGQTTLTEEEKSYVLDALKRGKQRLREQVLGDLIDHSKRNVIASIFLSKQEHILGFKDQQDVKHSGGMTIQVSRGPGRAKQLNEPAIEADFEEV